VLAEKPPIAKDDQADQEHENGDAVYAVHHSQIAVRDAFPEQGHRVEVVQKSSNQHGGRIEGVFKL